MISTSAPGSLMISGEHAVVYGHPAIVCAIDARVHITLTPADDGPPSTTSPPTNRPSTAKANT